MIEKTDQIKITTLIQRLNENSRLYVSLDSAIQCGIDVESKIFKPKAFKLNVVQYVEYDFSNLTIKRITISS